MQNQANKLILGATLCCAFPPAHVLDKFKREIEAHAKAVADAADAAEFGSETEAAEKAPLCLLLTSSLPTTNHLLVYEYDLLRGKGGARSKSRGV